MDQNARQTHSVLMGYILWIFGFTGSERFYYGKPISGTIYFLTLGLLFIGWFLDLFLVEYIHERENHTLFLMIILALS